MILTGIDYVSMVIGLSSGFAGGLNIFTDEACRSARVHFGVKIFKRTGRNHHLRNRFNKTKPLRVGLIKKAEGFPDVTERGSRTLTNAVTSGN